MNSGSKPDPVRRVLVSGLMRGTEEQTPGFSVVRAPPSAKTRIQQELEEQEARERELQQERDGHKSDSVSVNLLAPATQGHMMDQASHQNKPWSPKAALPSAPKTHWSPQSADVKSFATAKQPATVTEACTKVSPQVQANKEVQVQQLEDALTNVEIDSNARATLQEINKTMKQYFEQGQMPPAVKQKLSQRMTSKKAETIISNMDELKDFFPLIDPSRLQELCQKLPDVQLMLKPENIPTHVVDVKRTKRPPQVAGVQVTNVTVTTPQTKPVKVGVYDSPERSDFKPTTESPIDRDIRLAREREHEMKRQRGLAVDERTPQNVRVVVDTVVGEQKQSAAQSQIGSQLGKKQMMKDIASHDVREQHYQDSGMIKTTSKMTRDQVCLNTHGSD